MPRAIKGQRFGGRVKGTPNKRTELKEVIDRMNVKPWEGMAMIADDAPIRCSTCRGKGRTQWQPRRGEEKISDRPCESCYGSGFERVSLGLRFDAMRELMGYCYPKLKALEVSGNQDKPVQHVVVVEYVDPPNGNSTSSQ